MDTIKNLIREKWFKKPVAKTPLYQQVVAFIKDAVICGELEHGYSLPGYRKLAEMFEVSRNTILRALEVLEDYEYIVFFPRSHTLINHPCKNIDWQRYLSSNIYNLEEYYNSSLIKHRNEINLSTGITKAEEYQCNEFIAYLPLSRREDALGTYLLRQQIAEYLIRSGIKTVVPEEILIVTSALYALNLLFISLLGLHTNLVIPQTSNLSRSSLIRQLRSEVIEVDIDDDGIIPESLIKTIYANKNALKNTLLCFSPDLNIPTGTVTSLQRRKDILAVCTEHNIPIIEYTQFPMGCQYVDLPSLKSMDNSNNVIYVNQLGPVSSVANPWFGWIVVEPNLLKVLADINVSICSHQNLSLQLSAHTLFRMGSYDLYVKRMFDVRKERAAKINELLQHYLGDLATWNEHNIDACVWLKFKGGIDAERMREKATNIKFHTGRLYKASSRFIYLGTLTLTLNELEKGLAELRKLALGSIVG